MNAVLEYPVLAHQHSDYQPFGTEIPSKNKNVSESQILERISYLTVEGRSFFI